MRFVCPVAIALFLCGCASRSVSDLGVQASGLTHGVAAGGISSTGAVVWARCSEPGPVHVRLSAADGSLVRDQQTQASPEHDRIGKLPFAGLQPGRRYSYLVWCGKHASAWRSGAFSTAAAADAAAPVRFLWGGDLGGQNVCRDRQRGYEIFDVMRARSPDFFVALGDMIYADDACKELGRYGNRQVAGPPAPALNREMFWDMWKYNRADAAFQALLATTPMYPVVDDHEIMNDAGPRHDTLPAAPDTHLLEAALAAYADYQPIVPTPENPTRHYRSVRWGRHLELFILNLRQYRDSNRAPDPAERPKTMLGDEQRRWLLDAFSRSDATWKVVVSSVPLSIPTGTQHSGHDGWTGFGAGDGFERERAVILDAMRRARPRNFVWITTDVHFGAVFRYRPFRDDPEFFFDELISGPLTAGIFPQESYDRTIGSERLFRYGPASATAVASYDEALSWFNFGTIEVGESGELTSKLVNGRGEVVYEAVHIPR
jgi:alkaline phosphatase D